MQMIYKVTVEVEGRGSLRSLVRSFLFADRESADLFAKMIEIRADVRLVGTSIDHLMSPREAMEEVDQEIDMVMRVAYSEQL